MKTFCSMIFMYHSHGNAMSDCIQTHGPVKVKVWVSMPTSASNIYSYKHLHHILWGLMYFYFLLHYDLQSWLERTPLLHSTAITLSGLFYRQEAAGMQEKQLWDLLRRTVKKQQNTKPGEKTHF